MKPPDWVTCTEEELWKYIAWYLAIHGIDTVLVGGAVASIYSKGIYRSGDLDLVNLTFPGTIDPSPVLKEIGFEKRESRHYIHPDCKHLFIEFVSPPLSIGEDYNIVPVRTEIEGLEIKILSPTDCIKDRLASYVYFKARECLDQAVLVANNQVFDKDSVKKWCDNEGVSGQKAFEDFVRLFKIGKKKNPG